MLKRSTKLSTQLLGCLALLLSTASSLATKPAVAILKPTACDAIQITQYGGEGVMTASVYQEWQSGKLDGYIVTVDTRKLSFNELQQTMQDEGCFEN